MYLLAFLTLFPLQAPAPCPSGLEHLSYKVWKCKWFHFQGHHTARFSLTPSHAAVIWRTSRLNCFDVWSRWSLPLSLSLSDDATSPHSLPNGANQCPDFRTVSSVPFLGFSSLLVYVRACFFCLFSSFLFFYYCFFLPLHEIQMPSLEARGGSKRAKQIWLSCLSQALECQLGKTCSYGCCVERNESNYTDWQT